MATSIRNSKIGYKVPPLDHATVPVWIREIVNVIRGIMQGKVNTSSTVTLSANEATTTVSDYRIGPNTVIHLHPTTANAATALTGTYQTYPNATERQAVLNHANNAQADRTFAVTYSG